MTFDEDGTVVLSEADVADLVIAELSRRGLVVGGRPYFVRFKLTPDGAFVTVPGSEPLAVVVRVEPRTNA